MGHVIRRGAIHVAPLLFVFVASSSAQESPEVEPDVRYTIELLDPLAPLVGIGVETAGDADGVSEFTLSEGWAGIAETGRDLELVEARGASDLLEHERASSATWRVRHAAGEELALTFELRPTAHRASSGPPEYYLPILEQRLLHLIGAQALPAPAHLDGAAGREIALGWRGFEAEGWRVISSYAAGEAEVIVRRPLDGFRHALFLAGDLRLLPREVHGQPLWIAIAGEWSFADDEYADLAARIVALGRDFFAEHGQPCSGCSSVTSTPAACSSAPGSWAPTSTSTPGTGSSPSRPPIPSAPRRPSACARRSGRSPTSAACPTSAAI